MPDDEANLPESLPERIWRVYKLPLLLGAVSLFLIVFSVVLLVKSTQVTTPITFSDESATSSGKPNETIMVDVEGAVMRPGVYALTKGARVEEAIAAAGGLSTEADLERIAKTLNRAAVLVDGAKLFLPKVGEDETSHNISNSSNPPNPSSPNLVSVNTASQAELEALSGIGPVTAQKIIAGRPYQSLTELVAKRAMSQSLFNKLRNSLSL